jgi:hypothetical protein
MLNSNLVHATFSNHANWVSWIIYDILGFGQSLLKAINLIGSLFFACEDPIIRAGIYGRCQQRAGTVASCRGRGCNAPSPAANWWATTDCIGNPLGIAIA